MIHRIQWFDRQFSFDLPVWMYPNTVERLRGAPACLEDRVGSLPQEVLTRRQGGKWSIQENVGHLLDLEPLWSSRLDVFLAGGEELQPADLGNRKTHEANHNAKPIEHILESFRLERAALVQRLDGLDETLVMRAALHPRLNLPMRVLDLVYFVAEHDTHHLARITELIHVFRRPTPAPMERE